MKKQLLLSLAFIAGTIACANAQQKMKPEDTEFYSPVPPVVTPGKTCGEPPSDAIILFDGKNLDKWESANDTTKKADWFVHNGIMTVNKKAGNIQTKQRFMDYQIHLEWREPKDIQGSGQARGNSGLFLASTGPGDDGYELQILDNYNNSTYVNGQAGAVYKQYAPLVNANFPPGVWQSYDVIWTAPRFNEDGSLKSPAKVTAFFNGILIQNNVKLKGPTLYIGLPHYKAHGPSPIKLQAHGDKSKPISFRNIWVRPLDN
ncbi:MAG TPA: DUF1080 domain-containing protein [Hanamia sp.]|nr:DUF1080 domain-containing protein [Hanamia sp.]